MKWNRDDVVSWKVLPFITMALIFSASGVGAQMQAADLKSAEPQAQQETYQTLYLTNLNQRDALDIQTGLRNMLPRAKMYFVPSQNAISMRGTQEDIKLAQKILADIDRTQRAYRITYAITDIDNGKRLGTQRFALVVVSGGKTDLKQGNRVPVVTGAIKDGNSTPNTHVQYLDVGLNIEASLDGYSDGLRLRTKVEQSNVADEKSGIGAQDPMIRQTTLEGVSTLLQGKPLILGSIDIPGSTRRQEIEVVSEPVQ
jgi:type II secretory pathway component GspD/PulD (secretin)